MNVLVVGGAGYVGGAVTDLLLKSGHDFRVYDNLLYEDEYRKQVPFIYGNILDTNKLLPHLQWADAVIWLAALVGDGACAINPENTIEINQKTIEWLANHYNKRIIFTSTCSVYGAQDGLLTEESPTNPLSVYAASKLAAESLLSGKNAFIFRYGTLFGVSDLFSRLRLDLVLNTLTVRAYQQNHISVFGGDQYRPLLHVKDAARGILAALESDECGIFNLHSENIKILDLAYKVKEYFSGLKVEVTPMNFEDSRNYRVNSNKINKALKFIPQYSINDGILEIKNLLDEHRIKEPNLPKYTNQGFLQMFMNREKKV